MESICVLSSFVRRRQHARHLCRRKGNRSRAFSGVLLLRSPCSSGVARLQACIVALYSIIICSSCWEGDKKACVRAVGRSSRVVWWLQCRPWPARRTHGRRFFAKFRCAILGIFPNVVTTRTILAVCHPISDLKFSILRSLGSPSHCANVSYFN